MECSEHMGRGSAANRRTGSLGDSVRAAITECGLTRYEISVRTGVAESVLSRFLAGKSSMTLDTLERLQPVLRLALVVRDQG